MNLCVNLSTGELLDKLSILELKKEIIKDENKLIEIKKELEELSKVEFLKNQNIFYFNILKWINYQIWLFTDQIKSTKILDENFAFISNKIFNYNQYRFRVKNILNFNSNIKEQKSYASNNIKIKVDFDSYYSNLSKINMLSVLYDQVIFCTNNIELVKIISTLNSTPNFIFSNDEGQSIDEIIICDFEDTDVFNFLPINYVSGGRLGDFIHQLSICYDFFLKTGRKANIYITDTNREKFYLGAQTAHSDLYTILKKQNYVNEFKLYSNEYCDINLSAWTESPLLYKTNWYKIFLDYYNVDWAKNKWINIEPNNEFKDYTLINVSMSRYVDIEYNNLPYSKNIMFICFNKIEYDNFCVKSKTCFPYYVVKNVEDMFKSIAGCYCFIGNLSSPLAFAISIHKYCIGLIGYTYDTIHMKDVEIPNYYYYQNQSIFTKNIFDKI
jgi:hypothetical protein